MRYLQFRYYDDTDEIILDNESQELRDLIVEFFDKKNKYKLVCDLIVSEIKYIHRVDILQDFIKYYEDNYFCVEIDEEYVELFEIFNKIKEMME